MTQIVILLHKITNIILCDTINWCRKLLGSEKISKFIYFFFGNKSGKFKRKIVGNQFCCMENYPFWFKWLFRFGIIFYSNFFQDFFPYRRLSINITNNFYPNRLNNKLTIELLVSLHETNYSYVRYWPIS